MILRIIAWIFGWLTLHAVDPDAGGGGEEVLEIVGDDKTGVPAEEDGGSGDEPPAGKTDAEMTAEMAAAMKAGLSGEDKEPEKPAGKEPASEADKAAAKQAAEKAAADKAAANEVKTAETKAAEERKVKAESEALAKKKADDFQLSEADKKVLGTKAQARFHELHRFAKAKEEAERVANEQVEQYKKIKDDFFAVFKEHNTEPEELVGLLEYNNAVKTGNYEVALKIIENQRAGLLRALGKEAPGVDLLSEFDDLNQRVANQELTRADALELAAARRAAAAQHEQAQQGEAERQASARLEQERERAFQAVEKWTKDTSRVDVDYKAKEARILPKLEGILRNYPPSLWLSTVQTLYEAIEIPKASSATDAGGNGASSVVTPLRPTGQRGGQPAPADMTQALKQGLGYK